MNAATNQQSPLTCPATAASSHPTRVGFPHPATPKSHPRVCSLSHPHPFPYPGTKVFSPIRRCTFLENNSAVLPLISRRDSASVFEIWNALKQKPPTAAVARYLEWRANRIDDPIARLRYLRGRSSFLSTSEVRPKTRWHWIRTCLIILCSGFALLPFRYSAIASADKLHDIAPSSRPQDVPPDSVWQVESTPAYESYSNGLHIEKQYSIANSPRTRYRVYRREHPSFDQFEWRTGVAGIVFHTTESHVAAFEQAQTALQHKAALWTLSDIQKRRCYNYVIDRYGRVWRVVEEGYVAWHAGRSVWADSSGLYVDVNDSFLGIAFEAQTYDESQTTATPAQIHSAKALTEMLRSKYKIPSYNCATHAQVSVSSQFHKIGSHTDWAGNFPFTSIGLPDNYALPLPSVWAFGFDYDPVFVRATGNRMWQGLIYAEQLVREQASLAGMTAPQYKQRLQQRYNELIHALSSADEEPSNEK